MIWLSIPVIELGISSHKKWSLLPGVGRRIHRRCWYSMFTTRQNNRDCNTKIRIYIILGLHSYSFFAEHQIFFHPSKKPAEILCQFSGWMVVCCITILLFVFKLELCHLLFSETMLLSSNRKESQQYFFKPDMYNHKIREWLYNLRTL